MRSEKCSEGRGGESQRSHLERTNTRGLDITISNPLFLLYTINNSNTNIKDTEKCKRTTNRYTLYVRLIRI